jgi:hypothetical protein
MSVTIEGVLPLQAYGRSIRHACGIRGYSTQWRIGKTGKETRKIRVRGPLRSLFHAACAKSRVNLGLVKYSVSSPTVRRVPMTGTGRSNRMQCSLSLLIVFNPSASFHKKAGKLFFCHKGIMNDVFSREERSCKRASNLKRTTLL